MLMLFTASWTNQVFSYVLIKIVLNENTFIYSRKCKINRKNWKINWISYKKGKKKQKLCLLFQSFPLIQLFTLLKHYDIQASKPKWVNPILNTIGVNLLRLGGLHIIKRKYFIIRFTEKFLSTFLIRLINRSRISHGKVSNNLILFNLT